MCKLLLQDTKNDNFWNKIITSNEKWIFLKNPNKQWVQPDEAAQLEVCHDQFQEKNDIVFAGTFEVLYFELVPDGQAVD